jgi:hypothetical protein
MNSDCMVGQIELIGQFIYGAAQTSQIVQAVTAFCPQLSTEI